MASNILSPYNNTVLFNNDSLDKLIQLVKTYPVAGPKTGIRVVPVNNNYNLQFQNAHKYASTSSMAQKSSTNELFNTYEQEIDTNFSSWATEHAAQICIIDTSVVIPDFPADDAEDRDEIIDTIRNGGRYTWVQGGSLLEFYSHNSQCDQTTNSSEIETYKSTTTAGTFTIVENNGTKAHLVRINGFDENGNFNGGSLNITSEIEASRKYNNSDAPYGSSNIASQLTLEGSITTFGGISAAKDIMAYKVHAAVFNDYAEYRNTTQANPGQCVIECGDGSMKCSTDRLQAGANIVSDTFGFSIGETDKAQTPIAVCGRVLAYPYENKKEYKAGDAVCSAPDGKISLMTREEIKEWPDRIVGYVSEIPTYETWGSNNVAVNGRIWIKIK